MLIFFEKFQIKSVTNCKKKWLVKSSVAFLSFDITFVIQYFLVQPTLTSATGDHCTHSLRSLKRGSRDRGQHAILYYVGVENVVSLFFTLRFLVAKVCLLEFYNCSKLGRPL
jgi:hypothetical protein